MMSTPFYKRRSLRRKHNVYKQLPLDPTKQQIRLLELSPGGSNDKLTGRLFVASLRDCPAYDALSYVWGDTDSRYVITLQNKTRFTIGRNLHNALKDLRYTDRTLTIWTDAISIDQDNNEEVGHQVERMRQIYSQAHYVRAWIDHEINLDEDIFYDLPQILDGTPKITRGHDLEYWMPAVRLLQNSYWTRLWVQQELILARNIAIHCRKTTLDPDVIRWLLRVPDDLDIEANNLGNSRLDNLSFMVNANHHRPFYGGISRARNIVSRRSYFKQTSDSPLLSKDFTWASLVQLFINTSGLQTSEQRDRVFGLLGVAYDFEVGDININYELPVNQVYAQIPNMYIKKYSSLMFLCYIEKFRGAAPGLPTWLPAPEKHALFWWNGMEATAQFTNTKAHGAFLHSDDMALSVRGVCVDKITWTPPSGQPAGSSALVLKSDLEDFAKSVGKSPDELGSVLDKENVVNGLFPWVTNDELRHRNLPRLTLKQKKQAVLRLFEIAEMPEMYDFNVDDIFYGIADLSHIAMPHELAGFRAMSFSCCLDTLFGTAEGRLSHADRRAPVQEGDEIWALYGCPLPVILRPSSSTKKPGYTWIACPSNLPGLVKGEGLKGFPEDAEVGFEHKGRKIQQIDLW